MRQFGDLSRLVWLVLGCLVTSVSAQSESMVRCSGYRRVCVCVCVCVCVYVCVCACGFV